MASHLDGTRVDLDAAVRAAAMLVRCFAGEGKVLIFGNGGSAASAQHFAGEFIGRMLVDRAPLPALALTADATVITAIANDFGFEQIFARQLRALGRPGDVAVAISTSGRSPNVLAGMETARQLGMGSIGLVGAGISPLQQLVDVAISATSTVTTQAQETHVSVQHALCASVEAALFGCTPLEDTPPATRRGNGVVGWDELLQLRAGWRRHGRAVVLLHGAFELLHAGHVHAITAASQLGDVLVVGVDGDAAVRATKGDGRPLVPASRRAEAVAAVRTVDHVVIVEESEELVSCLRPDIVCAGADTTGHSLRLHTLVQSYGGQVQALPRLPGLSTAAILHGMRGGEG
jgi:rfaE bifunctional protein nucleotidyltransferase chain/domain